MREVAEQLIAIMSAAIGLAIIATLVSKQANTTSVISSASTGFAAIIGAAVAPVSGGNASTGVGGFTDLSSLLYGNLR